MRFMDLQIIFFCKNNMTHHKIPCSVNSKLYIPAEGPLEI